MADINADGQLEMVAADSLGNVAAFTAAGKEVWETHLNSQIHQVGRLRQAGRQAGRRWRRWLAAWLAGQSWAGWLVGPG